MPQPLIFRMIDKAVYDYNMIEKNDRILVGASGGKDSTALIEYFANRAKRPDCDFEFKALHVSTEITKPLDSELERLFASWGVKTEEKYVDVLGRIKEGHKMNCWWCSTQRRTELLNYAIENGFNKIALGHHLDDILETLLMNAVEHGNLATMPPRLKYKKFPVSIIRPLCYVPVARIKEHAENSGYASVTCTCTYQANSGRKDARKKLDVLTDGIDEKKQRFFQALRNIQTEYLP